MSRDDIRILLVEDDETHAGLIRRAFRSGGFESQTGEVKLSVAGTLGEARRHIEQSPPDLLITDLLLPDGRGIELLEAQEDRREFPAIVMTSFGDEQAAVEAIKAGALDYIVKSKAALADLPHFARRALREWENIVERRRAEEALQDSEGRFRSISQAANDAIIMADDQGRVSYWNPAAEIVFGFKKSETVGGRLVDLIFPERFREELSERFQTFGKTGYDPCVGTTFEIPGKRSSGTEFPMELSLGAFKIGGRWHSVGIVRDVTDRKQAEEELAKARDAAEAANRAKSEFLANMSHEIRTPMTAIMGFTDLLMAFELPPVERQEYLQTIHRNAENLLTIINDILDLSKIEAEKIELERANCSPCQVVEEVRSLMALRAAEKDLRLDVECTSPLPETIHTDPLRLRQILVNLVGNAIKFTKSGGVRVTARCTTDKDAAARIEFQVADTGIGMTADEMAALFRPFSQADASTTRRFGGTGLGLSISQRLAKMLGGRLDVESRPGEGSTFTLSIDPGPLDDGPMLDIEPLSKVRDKGKQPKAATGEQTLRGRILLAEDGEDIQRLVSLVLQKTGLEVDTAENGLLAYDKAMASKAMGRPFDLILMDIQMPELDGYETARRLRENGWQGPIVALTARAMVGDREKCLAAGCDEHLPKPLAPEELENTLMRYLDQPAVAMTQPPTNSDEPSGGASGTAGGLMASRYLSDAEKAGLLEAFVGELRQRVAKIQSALQAEDLPLLEDLSHQLKGTAAIYGLEQISDTARAVNRRASEKAEPGQLLAAVTELVEMCQSMIARRPAMQDNHRRP